MLDGTDIFGAPMHGGAASTLGRKFHYPPFTVLSARDGWWQDRKREWLALGIQSELGRGEAGLDLSATVAGISDPAEREAYNAARRGPAKNLNDGTVVGQGGLADQLGKSINARRSAAPGGQMSDTIHRLKPSADGTRKAGNGKRKAATFGQDIMRGEHVVGEGEKNPGLLGYGAMATEYSGKGGPLPFAGNTRPGGGGNAAGRDFSEPYAGGDAWAASGGTGSGTSIFDPVLTELCYRWFCPPGGQILDPFAGGSVRGIVAGALGFKYMGVELRGEQVAANRAQAHIAPAEWRQGDSRHIQKICADVEADFLFSCPPYGDLEVYSDDPADLSTLGAAEFRAEYAAIIGAACALLKPNRFAAFVVGDYRDKAGHYVGFPAATQAAFEAAGLRLYNEAILVTAVGSLPVRVTKQFEATRKMGKTHQNVLVFVKGDPRKAAEACRAGA